MFVELMRPEMRLTEKGEAYFGKVKYALRTVSEMLGTLLDLSRLDASTVEPEIEVISVNLGCQCNCRTGHTACLPG